MGIAQWRHGIVSMFFYSFLAITFFSSFISASTLRVPEEYGTIQSAINAAVDFDTVLINDGTYTGDGNRDIDFLGKAIVVKSVNGAASTIIDCQADSTNPHRGFIFHSGEDSLSILQGLTIQNGYAPDDVMLAGSYGGGILCDSGSSLTITECIITQNRAQNSGGGLAIFNSSPTISKCTISSNVALNYSGFVIRGLGGGVHCNNSDSKVISCDIRDNRTNAGGGISSINSNLKIDSCRITNNITEIFGGIEPIGAGIGGGIYLRSGAPELSYCEVTGNTAKTYYGVVLDDGKGGGLYCYLTSITITNCTIARNVAQGWPDFFTGTGAGIFCHTSAVTLNKTIVAFNEEAESIYLHSSATISIDCTDIFSNEYGDWLSTFDSLQNQSNNFSADPQFCDPASDDYQLSQSSSCLEGQSLCGERVGVYGMGCISTGVGEEPKTQLPESFILHQNYPNPFNATTTISFDSLTKSPFQLSIYNILGEAVYSLNGIAAPGINSFVWNADNFASGIYFYSLKLDTHEQTRKMLLLK